MEKTDFRNLEGKEASVWKIEENNYLRERETGVRWTPKDIGNGAEHRRKVKQKMGKEQGWQDSPTGE